MIATVCGVGFCPVAPGTVASLVGLGIAAILAGNPAFQVAGCGVAAALALWSSGPTARALGKNDPSCVVIDEVAGMMAAVAALPISWPRYLAAFLLFRLLDIAKPFPINRLERLPGSWGMVLDDLLAGLIANLLLRGFLALVVCNF